MTKVSLKDPSLNKVFQAAVEDKQIDKNDASVLVKLAKSGGLTTTEKQDLETILQQKEVSPEAKKVLEQALGKTSSSEKKPVAENYKKEEAKTSEKGLSQLQASLKKNEDGGAVANRAMNVFLGAIKEGKPEVAQGVLSALSEYSDKKEGGRAAKLFFGGENLAKLTEAWPSLSDAQKSSVERLAKTDESGSTHRLFLSYLRKHNEDVPQYAPEKKQTYSSSETSAPSRVHEETPEVASNPKLREALNGAKLEVSTTFFGSQGRLEQALGNDLGPPEMMALSKAAAWRDIANYTGELGEVLAKGAIKSALKLADAGQVEVAVDFAYKAAEMMEKAIQDRSSVGIYESKFSGGQTNLFVNKDTGEATGAMFVKIQGKDYLITFTGTIDQEHIKNGKIQGMNIESASAKPL